MYKFYDTSSLLLSVGKLFDNPEDKVVISSITLKELERIKTAANKDAHIKYAARQLLHQLDTHDGDYICHIFTEDMLEPFTSRCFEVTDDIRILATAKNWIYNNQDKVNDFAFVTNDIALKKIATVFFDTAVESITEDFDEYRGYEELHMSNDAMAEFYSSITTGDYNEQLNLLIGQYLNIYDENNTLVDTYCWTGEKFRKLKYHSFTSRWLGEIRPKADDIYQAMVADSLANNQVTMIKGPAGSGKTHLSLGYLFSMLDRNKIDKIIIFCNTVAAKNAAKLGYYPGTKDEKLLDSQIGNLLSSKLGGRVIVEQLINEEKLLLLPMSDIRGYDTSGMHAGIYISEAQNLDISLLKLALQRAGDDCIFILDGDIESQVDLLEYEGLNNGMRRASKVFRNHDIYGEVTLQKVHRSKIAEIANDM